MNAEKSLDLARAEEIVAKYGGKIKVMTPEELEREKRISRQILFSKKYRNGLKSVMGIFLHDLHQTHPDMPLSEVLVTSLKDINPELPAEVLLEITTFIIEEWEKSKVEELVLA